jgi:hypothetical protein
LPSLLLSKILDGNIHNYKFTSYFVWVWNLVCHCKWRT